MPKSGASRSVASSKVADALGKSKLVKDKVRRAADDLTVVHAVLDKEIPATERSDEVDRAVKRTDQVEKKLQESVTVLEDVAKNLEAEVKRKEQKLEREAE